MVFASLTVGDERALGGNLRDLRHWSGIGIDEALGRNLGDLCPPSFGNGNEKGLTRGVSGDIG